MVERFFIYFDPCTNILQEFSIFKSQFSRLLARLASNRQSIFNDSIFKFQYPVSFAWQLEIDNSLKIRN